jgi:GNAT superfamily N-acetyltransferase
MSEVVIRRILVADQPRWSELWKGFNAFYRRTVEDRVTERLWERLLKWEGEPFGFVAEVDRNLVGFAHYFFVSSTSDWDPRCYMQDLYADQEARGRGVGRALIEAVYVEADRHSASQTFWLTEDSNAAARQLYDRVGKATSFIKYRR